MKSDIVCARLSMLASAVAVWFYSGSLSLAIAVAFFGGGIVFAAEAISAAKQ